MLCQLLCPDSGVRTPYKVKVTSLAHPGAAVLLHHVLPFLPFDLLRSVNGSPVHA